MGSDTPRVYRADRDWEEFGRQDPYWAVLTETRFRGATMSQVDRDEFFASGEAHVGAVFASSDYQVGGAWPPRRALDFGCGVGRLLPALAKRCEHVVAVDVSPAMIEEAGANCRRLAISNVELVCDGEDLRAVPADFDLIHSLIVFQHIDPARGERILARLCDKLAPGGLGVLHFTVDSRESWFTRSMSALRDSCRLLHATANLLSGRRADEPLMRMHVYSLPRLEAIVRDRNCQVIAVDPFEVPKHNSVLLWLRKDRSEE